LELDWPNNPYYFQGIPGLTKAILTTTTVLTQNTFGSSPSMTELDVRGVVTWQKSAINGSLPLISVIDIKKCTSFGTSGLGGRGITTPKTGAIFNVNIALLTSNAGAVNADMLYYKTNYACIINFYDNSGNYVSTL
jgi:hypothetical protein